MAVALKKVIYPHISTHRGIAGGAPIIEGTRITVRCIAGYYQMGMSVDEILTSLSHLSPSQVYSALAYYFDHKGEIDKNLEASYDIEYWKQHVVSRPLKKATK